ALHTLEALRGQTAEAARVLLGGLDFVLDEEVLLFSASIPADSVAAAEVTAASDGSSYRCDDGCEAYAGDTITLFVSLGAVPGLTGETVADATALLNDAGLAVSSDRIERFHDTSAEGQVIGIADRPQSGSWRPGETVELIVSKGPELF